MDCQVKRKQLQHMVNFVRIFLQDVSYNFQHRARMPVQCPGNSSCTARLHTTVRLLLKCCGHFFKYRRMHLFLPLPGCISNEPVISNFCIICFRPMTLIGPTPYTLQCPEFSQSYCCTILILVVQLCQ